MGGDGLAAGREVRHGLSAQRRRHASRPTSGPPEKAAGPHFDLGMAAEFRVDRANTAVMPPTDGTVGRPGLVLRGSALVPGSRR